MATRDRGAKIIWRKRPEWGGAARAYLDLRKYGKGRVALIPDGATYATSDPETAQRLANKMLAEHEGQRLQAERLGLRSDCVLRDSCNEHLQILVDGGKHSPSWLLYAAGALDRACTFFDTIQAAQAPTAAERRRCAGPRNLATISAPDVRAFLRWLGQQPNGRGGTLGPGSQREHLAALSAVFARAISDGTLPLGANPVAALLDKPSAPPSPTQLLEIHEVALLMESARTLPRGGEGGRAPLLCAFELLAFLALTGAREGEARRTDVPDLDFRRNEIHLRGTKTEGADRVVPMHPQLRDILLPYVSRLGRLHGPLFPNAAGERVGDWRGTLDRIAKRAGFRVGAVRTRRFRVAYASHRCTCDSVDVNTVRLEMGHGSLAMMERVYARAQRRSERMGAEMAYRIDGFAERPDFAERLAAMREPEPGRARERHPVITEFLAAVAAWGTKRAERETGVDRATIQRLRQGRASSVQGRTLDQMRAYVSRLREGTLRAA